MSYKNELKKMFDLQKFGMKFGLDSMRSILQNLDNPHQGTNFVHLAGTNGKGSVGTMVAAMLTAPGAEPQGSQGATGLKVGFYTSPHLTTFRERIKINGQMISEEEVLIYSGKVWQACDPSSPPTFFEFVTALAFLYFKEKKVDLAVIEAGLGGRLDSTNVITPLVSVITSISLEHTEHLGDTLSKIALEKAGIVKAQKPVVVGPLPTEALDVVLAAAAGNESPALVFGRDFSVEVVSYDECGRPTLNFTGREAKFSHLKVNLAGPHQADNAAIALAVIGLLAKSGFKVGEEQIRQGLAQATWPGRAETFPAGAWPPPDFKGRAPLLLDGAHNPDGARALAAMLGRLDFQRLHLIVGVMADKDIAGVLAPIYNLAKRLYLTRPLFSRAATPELLLEKVKIAFGEPQMPTTLHPGLPEALAAAAAEAETGDLVLLSGSLFTVGEGRAYLTGQGEVESN